MPLVPALNEQVRHVIHQRVNQAAGRPLRCWCIGHTLGSDARLVRPPSGVIISASAPQNGHGFQPVVVVNQVVHVSSVFGAEA